LALSWLHPPTACTSECATHDNVLRTTTGVARADGTPGRGYPRRAVKGPGQTDCCIRERRAMLSAPTALLL
jgi:hypothetical protein